MANKFLFFHSPYDRNSTITFSNLVGGGIVLEVYYTELPQYRISAMPTLIYVDEAGTELGRIEDLFEMNPDYVTTWRKQFDPQEEQPNVQE